MGSDTSRFIVFMVFSSLLSSVVGGGSGYDPEALNALFRYYANRTLAIRHRAGTSSRVSLPSNLSGMEVSVVRLRSGSLWDRGVESEYVKIPPSVRTLPYVKRLAIVYDNLGNWSSKYYHVPGYSLVSPVIGFEVYNYTDLTVGNSSLSVTGEPISIRFPYLETEEKNVTRLKCVGFIDNMLVEFKNMTERGVCVTEKAGHFSIVVPFSPPPPSMPGKKRRELKWWVIGCGIGAAGLVVSVSVGVAVSRWWRKRKIKDMEKESDSSVALDTFWVRGDHKMPRAPMIRTQPTLEHDYVP